MISRDEIVGAFRWFNVESLTGEVSEQEIWACHCGRIIFRKASFKEGPEGFGSEPTFLDRLNVLFPNSTFNCLSRWASKALKLALQIIAVERRRGLQQASIKRCPPTRSTKQRTYAKGRADKSINTSSTPGNLLYNLFTWLCKVEQVCVWGTW